MGPVRSVPYPFFTADFTLRPKIESQKAVTKLIPKGLSRASDAWVQD
jgi:hypothetical protein